MCDDIDIEEHDVLDDPTIKNIFPDLSIIKKEISKYDETQLDHFEDTEEVCSIKTDTALAFDGIDKPHIKTNPTVTSDFLCKAGENLQESSTYPILRSLIRQPLLETLHLPCTEELNLFKRSLQKVKKTEKNEIIVQQAINSYELYQQELAKKLDTLDEPKASQDNIIILGSKPTQKTQIYREVPLIQTIEKYKYLKVKLTDINEFLMSCKRYCNDCLTLFPTLELYEAHAQHHSPNLITFGKINRQNVGGLASKQYTCECGTSFVSIGNYRRHLKNIHKRKFSSVEKLKQASKPSSNAMHECFHCDKLFTTQKEIIDHLYEVLEPSNTTTKDSDKDKLASINTNELQNEETTIHEQSQDNTLECNAHTEIGTKQRVKNGPVKRIKPGRLSLNRNKIKKKKLDDDDNDSDCVMEKKYKCATCLENFVSQRNLDHHVEMHNETVNKIIEIKANIEVPDKLYRCHICSRYNIALRSYSEHMLVSHNLVLENEIQKVEYDPQCRFCSSKLSTVKVYNIHISKYHKKQFTSIGTADLNFQKSKIAVNKPFNKNNFACKSVLFKCMKCDVFFLSANETMCHLEHIEILVNWKCLSCKRIFKKKDMKLHLQQHTDNKKFDVYALSECELGRVLYKCLNCAVHFSERNYLYHYSICRIEDPNSTYCNVCDILVNKADMHKHKTEHKENKLQPHDFTIIESDMLPGVSVKSAADEQKYIKMKNNLNKDVAKLGADKDKLAYVFSFCGTCNCYVTFIGLARRAHIEKTCGNTVRVLCKSCGLVLTSNLHKSHQSLHKTGKTVNLQSYIFYDLNSKKITRPSIPDFPKCDSCNIHFLRKAAVNQHECRDEEYSVCVICNTKFTERAYKLHMDYHNYTIPKDIHEHLVINDDDVRSNTGDIPQIDLVSNTEGTSSTSVNTSFLYNCESCGITVNSYQKVVLHCQDHYDPRINQVCMRKCDLCSLNLDPDILEAHRANHSTKSNSTSVINFDPFYFRYDNTFWKNHIFSYVSDEEIKNILYNSIFRFECRLKLEVIQSGASDFILYKCEKCRVFVDPPSIYRHAQNVCSTLTKYPCSHCTFAFDSQNHKKTHETLHKDGTNLRSEIFEILVFNKKSHSIYHKSMFGAQEVFILYQCRNCNGVVDKFHRDQHKCDLSKLKSCSNCGLLIYEKDFDLHFIRHEELDNFKTHHITILPFGKKHSEENHYIKSSFTGTVYDFTFYKCKRCDLCSKDNKITTEHVCLLGNEKIEKCQCPKCDLHFSKLELEDHLSLHKNMYEFDKCTLNVIHFKPSSAVLTAKDSELELNELTQGNEESENNTSTPEMLFKCDCGLHFLEKSNAEQHSKICNPKMKISRQSCFKCNLIFTPGELFNHLLQHHGDRKSQLNLIITNVKKKVT